MIFFFYCLCALTMELKMPRFALTFVACVTGSWATLGLNSAVLAQYLADEITAYGRCTGVCQGINWSFQIYGWNGGGGGGTSDCGGNSPFPQLLWEPPEPIQSYGCEIAASQLPPSPPASPQPGEVSVALSHSYEVDTSGDGNIDAYLIAPVVIVGRDADTNGVPDLWEGLMINGIARQIP
jgi:hypothetical protein